MAEKRPHQSNGYADTDSKRAKQSKAAEEARARFLAKAKQFERGDAPDSSKAQQTNGTQTSSKLDDFRARLAAASQKSGQAAKPKTSSPAPAVSASPQAPSTSGQDPHADIKARIAAAAAKTRSIGRTDSSQPPPPPQRQIAEHEQDAEHDAGGRGGLHTKLHPILAGGFGQGASLPSARQPTTLGNRRLETLEKAPERQLDLSAPSIDEIKRDNPYFDPSLSGKDAKTSERRERLLVFNMKGKYIAQADALRQQAHLEEMKTRIAAEQRRKALREDRSEQAFLVRDVPVMEWWDEGLIDGEAYPDFDNEPVIANARVKLEGDETIITNLIQHPVLLNPPSEGLKTGEREMYLTKTETKKLRRQKRMADLKEKQAKIRLGLQPPDPPKIKKSNLMRVLGEQAVKDPTAVEARVNAEIAQRREAHENINAERALTKEQRQERVAEKAAADAAKSLYQSVFRIGNLAYGKNRNKIDINAKQYHDLTGIMVTNPNCCCVVVEGGAYTTKAMKKLLLNRIEWTENAPSTALSVDHNGNEKQAPPEWLRPVDEEGKVKDLSNNGCVLVWEGEVKQRAFKFWAQRDCETDGAARQTMERNGLENAWAACRGWTKEI